MTNLMRSTTLVFGFLILWQLLVNLDHLPPYILPPPISVLIAFYRDHALIAEHLLPTLTETFFGLLLGIVFGVMAALLFAISPRLARWFWPTIIISQAIPTFAIAPLFIIWLGYGLASKIAVTILMIFFPILSTFYDGLRATPVGFLDLAKTMNATTTNIYTHLKIPAALPALGSGLRIAAVTAPLGAIVGEWVGSSQGLGYLMLYANERLQIDMMFAVLMVIIILSLLLYFTVDRLLRIFINW